MDAAFSNIRVFSSDVWAASDIILLAVLEHIRKTLPRLPFSSVKKGKML